MNNLPIDLKRHIFAYLNPFEKKIYCCLTIDNLKICYSQYPKISKKFNSSYEYYKHIMETCDSITIAKIFSKLKIMNNLITIKPTIYESICTILNNEYLLHAFKLICIAKDIYYSFERNVNSLSTNIIQSMQIIELMNIFESVTINLHIIELLKHDGYDTTIFIQILIEQNPELISYFIIKKYDITNIRTCYNTIAKYLLKPIETNLLFSSNINNNVTLINKIKIYISLYYFDEDKMNYISDIIIKNNLPFDILFGFIAAYHYIENLLTYYKNDIDTNYNIEYLILNMYDLYIVDYKKVIKYQESTRQIIKLPYFSPFYSIILNSNLNSYGDILNDILN